MADVPVIIYDEHAEECVCCGARATKHPIIGIGRSDLGKNVGEMKAHPVCAECWQDPSHRKRPVKVAFHLRSNEVMAVTAARIFDEKSKRGEDLAVQH